MPARFSDDFVAVVLLRSNGPHPRFPGDVLNLPDLSPIPVSPLLSSSYHGDRRYRAEPRRRPPSDDLPLAAPPYSRSAHQGAPGEPPHTSRDLLHLSHVRRRPAVVTATPLAARSIPFRRAPDVRARKVGQPGGHVNHRVTPVIESG
jgi:hypothetical protein